MGLFTDLNLNGDTPLRVRPKLGAWGPQRVPSTRRKKIQRVLAPIVFVLVLAGVVALGYLFFRAVVLGR